MQRSGKHDPYPGGEIGNGEDPPAPPEAPPRLKRAALILHCGGRAVAGTRGGIVIFSDNIITAHTDLMYVRLTASFRFSHDEITYLSPFFQNGPRRNNVSYRLLNRRGSIASDDGRRIRDDDIDVAEGVTVLDGPNTLAEVRAFFNRVRSELHDQVFVYIHGHGNAERRFDGRLVLADETNAPSEFASFADVAMWINAIQANHIGVAVDTCYSGQLARRIQNRRHLLVAMSTGPQDLSLGDGENGYHKVRRGKFGDWSDLFIFNFTAEGEDDKVDVATDRASKAIGTESLNLSPRRAPRVLTGRH
ncbi:MAG: hypothetical protein WCH75_17575 [Candidatus Binatia bacterium]